MATKKKTKKTGTARKRVVVVVDIPKLDTVLDKATREPLTQEESDEVKSALHHLADRNKPRQKSETARALLGALAKGDLGDENTGDQNERKTKKQPGHGRNGVDDYVGATEVKQVSHPDLSAKESCPCCLKGKVYNTTPRVLLRVIGVPPIQASVFELEKLRCNLCGQLYTAPAPPGIGEDKYDASVASMLALLKYGNGMPWYRIEKLQQQMGIPLPASTQWELVDEAANTVLPVYNELVDQAAQGETLFRDDTSAQILEEVERPEYQDEDRTGIQTTAIVSEVGEHLIALFFTGPQHAGENLNDLLQRRRSELSCPTLMGDASASNDKDIPKAFRELLANCLTHARRQIVKIFDSFPEPCRHVIIELGHVYYNDEQARKLGLDDDARLTYHQEHSGPCMDNLRTWMQKQLDDKLVEPNSVLGKAFNYFLKRWDRLTLFLRHPGAPLDNNLAEQALKKAVLNRKNAMFFKTQHGADVADMFMTLIHTCERNKVNSFEYLTQLQRHATEIGKNPSAWLPWNYQRQLQPGPE